MTQYILSIDQGTTSSRAILFTLDGKETYTHIMRKQNIFVKENTEKKRKKVGEGFGSHAARL